MNLEEGIQLAVAVKQNIQADVDEHKTGILCPPFIHLFHLAEMLKEVDHLHVGAQNCHHEENGAYTGEIAAGMIRSIGASYVIIGHSERRKYFGETGKVLAQKVDIAMRHELRPIFCCGESLQQRENEAQQKVVEAQIREGLFHLDEAHFANVIIAYEPVWAIGTGKTATPAQAQEMHAFIRKLIKQHYHKVVADETSILYGGSIKPANAVELFEQNDIDGGLIGGASLNAEDFTAIYRAI